MNLREQKKNSRRINQPLSDNILKAMSPEDRKKVGQLTAKEAQQKWARDAERQMHVEVKRECLRQRIGIIEARMDKRSTIPKGHPDLTLMKDNHLFLLELKTEHGRLSDDQLNRIEELKQCGNDTTLANSTKEALEAIHAWLNRIGARHR